MILTLNQIVQDVYDYHIVCCSMNIEKSLAELGKLIGNFKEYKKNRESDEIIWYASMGIHKCPMTLGDHLIGYIMAETDGCGFRNVVPDFDDSER